MICARNADYLTTPKKQEDKRYLISIPSRLIDLVSFSSRLLLNYLTMTKKISKQNTYKWWSNTIIRIQIS